VNLYSHLVSPATYFAISTLIHNFTDLGVKHEPTDSITDVAKQLPPNSYMFIIYTPTEDHENVLTNTINRMVTDQTILKVEKDCTRFCS